MDEPTIVALIPGYQEGPRIAAVVEAAARHLPVIVVDDGSTDDTAAQAEAAGATVLIQRPNAGKGAALRAGFRHLLDRGIAAVVTLDADGQHDPAEIPTFLAAYEATGAELIIGRRDFAAMPPVRRLSNTLGGWVSLRQSVGAWPTTSRAIGSSDEG
jgi:glycosyltransferase involved in cell wall biosynthesis